MHLLSPCSRIVHQGNNVRLCTGLWSVLDLGAAHWLIRECVATASGKNRNDSSRTGHCSVSWASTPHEKHPAVDSWRGAGGDTSASFTAPTGAYSVKEFQCPSNETAPVPLAELDALPPASTAWTYHGPTEWESPSEVTLPASAITISWFGHILFLQRNQWLSVLHHLVNRPRIFRVLATSPTVHGLGMTFPHTATVHNVPHRSIRPHTIEMSTDALRASVSSSIANTDGSSPGRRKALINWRLYSANLPVEP